MPNNERGDVLPRDNKNTYSRDRVAVATRGVRDGCPLVVAAWMQVMGDRVMAEVDEDGGAMPFDGAWHGLGH